MVGLLDRMVDVLERMDFVLPPLWLRRFTAKNHTPKETLENLHNMFGAQSGARKRKRIHEQNTPVMDVEHWIQEARQANNLEAIQWFTRTIRLQDLVEHSNKPQKFNMCLPPRPAPASCNGPPPGASQTPLGGWTTPVLGDLGCAGTPTHAGRTPCGLPTLLGACLCLCFGHFLAGAGGLVVCL